MQWGSSEHLFKAVKEDTGVPHPADIGRPALRRDCIRYYEAFRYLGASRICNTTGPQPIQVVDVKAYLDIVAIDDPATRLKYLRLIQALDSVALKHASSNSSSA